MGTRGLLIFKHKGKYYSIYNHFDSYFEGLGINLVKEIKDAISNGTFDEWKNMLEKCKIIFEDDEPTNDDKEKLKDVTDLTVSRQSSNDWYCLLRKTQGSYVEPLTLGYLKLSNHNLTIKPECDLFIEYTYTLDFDNNTFTPCAYGEEISFNTQNIPEDWISSFKLDDE